MALAGAGLIVPDVHRCRYCACLHRKNADGTWSLADADQEPCGRCDNDPGFLEAIEPVPSPAAEYFAAVEVLERLKEEQRAVYQRQRTIEKRVDQAIDALGRIVGRGGERRVFVVGEQAVMVEFPTSLPRARVERIEVVR